MIRHSEAAVSDLLSDRMGFSQTHERAGAWCEYSHWKIDLSWHEAAVVMSVIKKYTWSVALNQKPGTVIKLLNGETVFPKTITLITLGNT